MICCGRVIFVKSLYEYPFHSLKETSFRESVTVSLKIIYRPDYFFISPVDRCCVERGKIDACCSFIVVSHTIGKNLVASMLEGCGFEVINLGVDISGEQFVEAVRKYNPQIVCLSALLTTTMSYMKEVIETLDREGLRDKVKVIVGGAPVNEEFARQIGADGYSSNANGAVVLAKKVLEAC